MGGDVILSGFEEDDVLNVSVGEGRALGYIAGALNGEYRFRESVNPSGVLDAEQEIKVAEDYSDLVQDLRGDKSAPEDYIPLIALNVGLGDDVIENSYEIYDRSEEYFDNSLKDEGVAAGTVYAGARLEGSKQGELTNQEEVAEAADVTVTTLWRNWQTLLEAHRDDRLKLSDI